MAIRATLVCWVAALVLAGCDKDDADKAQRAMKAAASKLSQEYEESKVVAHAQQVLGAVESRDLVALKRLCLDAGGGDYQAIMGCYYNAFAIEDRQGVEAARKHLAEEMAKKDTPPAKAKALAALQGYFQRKDSMRTRELAGQILILALEAKYRRPGGMVGRVLVEKLGLVAPPGTMTQPATTPSASPPAVEM